MTFRSGLSAAKGQPVTPGWVEEIVSNKADPLVPGNFMSFILVKSPSLTTITSLRTGLFGRVQWGVRPAVEWKP